MNLHLINDSSFKALKVICNGKEYFLKKENSLFIPGLPENTEIKFEPLNKNSSSILLWFFFGVLDMLIDVLPFTDGLCISLYSSSIYSLKGRKENCIINLKTLRADNVKWDDIIYFAPYIYSDDVDINSVRYEAKNSTKEKLKFYFIHFVLWIIIFFIAYSLSVDDSEIFRNVMGFIGALFALFTVWRMRKARLCFETAMISELLKEKDLEYRLNGNDEKPYEPKNFIEKRMFSFTDKVISRIFKDKK